MRLFCQPVESLLMHPASSHHICFTLPSVFAEVNVVGSGDPVFCSRHWQQPRVHPFVMYELPTSPVYHSQPALPVHTLWVPVQDKLVESVSQLLESDRRAPEAA